MSKAQEHDQRLHELGHDVRHCLHVIAMGVELLKAARNDVEQFSEICESLETERRECSRLVEELVQAACEANLPSP
jgi:signal transduction histidine kinase